MIELSYAQTKEAPEIANVLRNYARQFSTRLTEEKIQAWSERLAGQSIKGFEVEDSLESFLSLDDRNFPTPNEIRSRIKREATNSTQVSDQTIRDEREFQKNCAELSRILGPEAVGQFFRAWVKASGIDETYYSILGKTAFKRIAIADLMNSNKNVKRCLEAVKAKADIQIQKLKLGSEHFEDSTYKVFRGKTPRECLFSIK